MRVTCVPGPPADVEADVLVLPLCSDDTPGRGHLRGLSESVRAGVERGEIATKLGDTTWWDSDGVAARRLLLVGAGTRSGFDADASRRLAGVAARSTMASRSVALSVRSDALAPPAAEGFLLGAYDPDLYKRERKRSSLDELRIVAPGDVRRPVDEARILADATNLCRTLVSEPPNELTPTRLAERATEELAGVGVDVKVLKGRQLERFGALLGVAKGSDEPPVFITMSWTPPRARKSPVLGLVGKGITFDSGGLSLKPTEGMTWMKGDMAGAAAVIAAMKAIATLRVPLNVRAAVPATENMPSGKATRVGDVLRSYAGKTIEVLNTDAEGRLVLADALAWMAGQGATHIVDAATLTGAVEVALGKTAFGVMGRPDRWVDRVLAASRRAGEKAWPLPLYPEYRELLRSEIADIKNVGPRGAGTITAAWFLAEFVPDDINWAHLDIAGVAWNDGQTHLANGATGSGVRAFVRIAQDLAGRA